MMRMFTRSRKQGPYSEMDWEFLPYNQNNARFISTCDVVNDLEV